MLFATIDTLMLYVPVESALNFAQFVIPEAELIEAPEPAGFDNMLHITLSITNSIGKYYANLFKIANLDKYIFYQHL